MFFDGSHKAKRQINLGGKLVSAGRDLLLQRTYEERARRDEEKRRQMAAMKIQSFYRGRIDIHHRKAEIRSKWSISDSDNVVVLARTLQSFLYFFDARKHDDILRLDILCAHLIQSNALDTLMQSNDYELMMMRMTRICAHILCTITLLYEQFLRSGCLSIIHKGLLRMTEQQAVDMEISAAFISIVLAIVSSAKLTIVGASGVEQPSSTLVSLVVDVLSIPFLTTYMSSNAITQLQQLLFFDSAVLLCMIQNDTISKFTSVLASIPVSSDAYPFDSITFFASNWISIGLPAVIKRDKELILFVSVTDRVFDYIKPIEAIRSFINKSIGNNTSNDEDEDEIMDEQSIVNSTTFLYETQLVKTFSPLHNSHFIERIIQLISIDFNFADKACALLWNIARMIPSTKLPILVQLIFAKSANASSLLWTVVTESSFFRLNRNLKSLSITEIHGLQASPACATLTLLCDMLAQHLLTSTHEEFFDANSVLTLAQWEGMASFLRNIVFAMLMNPLNTQVTPPQSHKLTLKDAEAPMIRLIQQIHARNARHVFLPKDFWYMSDVIDIALFVKMAVVEDEEVIKSKNKSLLMVQARQLVLKNIPFVIPFENRIKIFHQFIINDKTANGAQEDSWGPHSYQAIVRRDHVFEDGFEKLNSLGAQLKRRIAITFISELGMKEAGIDGGGVFKEFLTQLSVQAFDVNLGLFERTKDQLLYPNPHEYAKTPQQLASFAFLGRILGKALYEGILVDVNFTEFFLSKWLGQRNFLADLPLLDPELYKNLLFLKNYDGNVEDLALTFSLTTNEFGTSKTLELVPNGKEIPVTNENRIRYIYLVANHKLNIQIARQCAAFFEGLSDLINPRWLQMFNQQELQELISGSETPIDLTDMRRFTQYGGEYNEQHEVIQRFWNVVDEFSHDERKALLKFITSCARPPLLGFKELSPLLCIRPGGAEQGRLPTSSTCVNLLKLPQYDSAEVMRRKLLYSIRAGAGFELS